MKATWKLAKKLLHLDMSKKSPRQTRIHRLLSIIVMMYIWNRRSLAEATRRPVRATFPAVRKAIIHVGKALNDHTNTNKEQRFLKKWHTRSIFERKCQLEVNIVPF